MNVRVKFFGGAGSVTGSKYLLEIDDFNLLVDCGLFQGPHELRNRNNSEFPIEPKSINAIILTHAHLDHSGYLPKLVKDGFNSTIYCTEATATLAEILLRDSAKLMKEESEFARKKGFENSNKTTTLYEIEDVEKTIKLWETYPYYTKFNINEHIVAEFFNAGHILGSSIVKLTIFGTKGQTKEIVFSGDIGRTNSALHYPPDEIKTADVLFIESTYGNKEMPEQVDEAFATIINKTFDKGGVLLIPSFAVGRTQQLIYEIVQLRNKNKIPKIPIYIDSPMAINVTYLFNQFYDYHKLNHQQFENVFEHDDVHYFMEQELSKSLNALDHAAIIISASGMCTGGRIMHHLYHRLPKPNDTLLFVGFQAEETKGRQLLEGASSIYLFGEQVHVNCSIEKINGLSAHADSSELLDFASHLISKPKWCFIVHGEKEPTETLQKKLLKEFQIQSIIPQYLESFELFKGI